MGLLPRPAGIRRLPNRSKSVIDIKLIREKPDEIKAALKKRVDDVDFQELLGWDDRRRAALQELERLRARKNEVSKLIPKMKKEGKDPSNLFAEMKENSTATKSLEIGRAHV